ncbi:ankyrin repeat domain-containing protein [Candidatus Rhabdochlamydia sp. T3358]|uniref:ankyrin repeat domain-containing protein n=1 Tax=Candidatus Rhabdochlamydia sp. T3358 TaxID=2099795 RepID=UPI0010B0375D|nr:ankyrin repeat domain-containing protein [Candidatus Rhabdochlamydia sp. T3358]VHN99541.1 Ankyrin repeats (3 copies) [Candidatus Rhabdochlamydia sp. T3358]
MTSPISFRDSSLQTNSSFSSDQKLSDRSQKLISLFKGMLPISNETTDYQDNHSRLWALKNGTLLGIVSHSDGKIICISSDKIINSCTAKPISLKNLKRLQDLQIDLAYIPEQKKLVVFPHLKAAGDDQKIAQVAAKSLNPQPPASWVPPTTFDENPVRLSHMFRRKKEGGHFTEDTPKNRAYIRAAVSDPSNRESINNFGVELYSKIMPDGYRAWAQVRNGLIINGGRDKPWRKWVDNNKKAGGQVESRNFRTYDKFTFQERVQADRLTEVYNKSVIKNPWKPHSVELRFPARDVGGVRHQTGIILDLLKELEEGVYDEYMFFLPATEGENLLSQEDVLQIAQEIARGVYIHDTIPFFSLNMNTDYQLYPIIHPEYQNTYVGYVIAMLDYHLKGFWSGQLFQEEFVQNWYNDPKTGERFLRAHSFPIQSKFASFDDILRNLAKEEGISVEQLASMSRFPVNISCRIIGKQKEINKAENLFVIDSDVDLIHTLEGTPDGEEEEAYFNLLDKACGILCREIKEVGFTLPEVKKWLEAAKMMNFFSSYYRTLQEGDKVPRFKENTILGKEKVCPPIFSPIPYARGPFVEFNAAGILKSLYIEERNILMKLFQTEREDASQKEQAKAIFVHLLKDSSVKERSDGQLSQEELEQFATTMLTSLKESYFSIEKRVEKTFVNLKIKKHPYQKLSKSNLLVRIDLAKDSVANSILESMEKQKRSPYSDHLILLQAEQKRVQALEEKQKVLKKLSLWVQDPLNTLVSAEKWFFDLEHNRLDIREKKPNGEFANVFGGYEPRLEDTESKQSPLAAQILKTHAKKLSSLESEEFLVLKEESGRLFKLPIEDSFPVSSHGIPYNTMMLMSPVKNSSDETFLSVIQAIEESNEEVFREIEKEIIDWNRLSAFGKSAIHYAATADSSFFLKALIDKKVDLLIKDSQGWTALHYAAAVGNLMNLELLLNAEKSLLNIPALNGETPLYLAVQKNWIPCVKMLLEVGADLSIKPMHGWNVLMSAIHNGHEEMALLLVKTGKVDLEASWRGGKVALHFAIEMEMEKLLEELLNRGADRNRTYNGQSPVSLASAQNWQRGIDLLHAEKTENQNPWCSVM